MLTFQGIDNFSNILMNKKIILITGVPGSGKTATSKALCDFFEKAIYIPVDMLRMAIKTGEDRECFELAKDLAFEMAESASNKGLVAVIDDILLEKDLKKKNWYKVYLAPELSIAKRRNRDRGGEEVEEKEIERIRKLLEENNTHKNGWIVIDNSELSIEQTVEIIIDHLK